jgi:5-formyltetrahydrofolate cyclo-ligase
MSGDARQLLREATTKARARLSPEARATLSRAAVDRVAALDLFSRARTVALYAPMGSELDPLALVHGVVAVGRRFAFPRIVQDERVLAFAECTADELVAGALGTREPPALAPAVPLEELDLVIVPGVAFDLEGGRLGRGRGYYDATLRSLPSGTPRLGLAFEVQIVPRVPVEPHDEQVDGLVTEGRTVLAGRRTLVPSLR